MRPHARRMRWRNCWFRRVWRIESREWERTFEPVSYTHLDVYKRQVSISPDKRDMFITAGLSEGVQYKFSTIKITGDTILPVEDLEKFVLFKEGQVFSRALLEYRCV